MLAPHIDDELNQLQAKCPFVRPWSGAACQWTGPYGEMRQHVHSFPDHPRPAHHSAPATDDTSPPAPGDLEELPSSGNEADAAAAKKVRLY